MSDFFNDENEEKKTNISESEYAYSYSQINQGETSYQWKPAEEPKKVKKVKSGNGFGKKLLKVVVAAVIFGLVSGVTFQAVTLGTNKILGASTDVTDVIEQAKEEETEKTTKEPISSTMVSTASTVSDVADIADNVIPAVVQVTNVGITEYRTFFGTQQFENTSCGSGIIINQDSDYIYIATNNHVIAGAETLTITFCDDSSVQGEVKGADSSCDLAVVSVKVSDIGVDTLSQIKVATVDQSDEIKVGESAVVIGNALGYGISVTTGVVSATNRQVELEDEEGNAIVNDLIQTDAAVNPGNSGGALLNMNGEVIGIVSAKYTDTDVEGMGYAIPISYASDIISQMIDNDVVSDADAAYLGVAGYNVTSEVAAQYDIPTGVLIQQVIEGSAAEKAGLEKGDVIRQFNGRTVTSMSTIQNALQYIPAGTTVEVVVAKASNDYEEVTYQVTLTNKNTTRI